MFRLEHCSTHQLTAPESARVVGPLSHLTSQGLDLSAEPGVERGTDKPDIDRQGLELASCITNQDRPHQALNNEPPGGLPDAPAERALLPLSEVRCRRRLGGLLKHYSRVA